MQQPIGPNELQLTPRLSRNPSARLVVICADISQHVSSEMFLTFPEIMVATRMQVVAMMRSYKWQAYLDDSAYFLKVAGVHVSHVTPPTGSHRRSRKS